MDIFTSVDIYLPCHLRQSRDGEQAHDDEHLCGRQARTLWYRVHGPLLLDGTVLRAGKNVLAKDTGAITAHGVRRGS